MCNRRRRDGTGHRTAWVGFNGGFTEVVSRVRTLLVYRNRLIILPQSNRGGAGSHLAGSRSARPWNRTAGRWVPSAHAPVSSHSGDSLPPPSQTITAPPISSDRLHPQWLTFGQTVEASDQRVRSECRTKRFPATVAVRCPRAHGQPRRGRTVTRNGGVGLWAPCARMAGLK